MLYPAKPANETERLRELRRLAVLDTDAGEALEALTRCAQLATGAPMSLITLIDEDRQWYLCELGVGGKETPRHLSFCAHAILTADPFIVPDAHLDDRFSDNPYVSGPPFVRAYLGVPLVTHGGAFALGTLCAIEQTPRAWSGETIEMMVNLAKIAMTLIEMRDLHRDLGAGEAAA